MRIWFAANIPPDSYGGVARSMRELASALRTYGHNTTVIFNSGKTRSGDYIFFIIKLSVRLLLNILDPPDWIIARSIDGIGCGIISKLFRLKTKIALHNHGWEEYAFETERRLAAGIIHPKTTWKAHIFRFPILRAGFKLCDICLSGTLAEIRFLKKKYPGNSNKLRYLPNGVSTSQTLARYGANGFPPYFLAIGNATWKKNLHHTVAVFEEIVRQQPSARLFLIGTGSGTYPSNWKKNKALTIVESEKPENMPQWFEKCPYFIFSSRYEGGHAFALLEAMSIGCLVFTTAIPSSGEIITNNVNGIFITGVNISQDAGTILNHISNPATHTAMRCHAMATSFRNRWERQAKRLEIILCTDRKSRKSV